MLPWDEYRRPHIHHAHRVDMQRLGVAQLLPATLMRGAVLHTLSSRLGTNSDKIKHVSGCPTTWRSAAKAAPTRTTDCNTGREEPRRSRGVAILIIARQFQSGLRPLQRRVGQPTMASLRRDLRTGPARHQPLIAAESAMSVLHDTRMVAPASAFPRKRRVGSVTADRPSHRLLERLIPCPLKSCRTPAA